MARVAVLGMGAMGARMATRLADAGHGVTVWNRTPGRISTELAAKVKVASTPRLAATDADLAIAMVRDDEASSAVWLDQTSGAIHGLSGSAVAIESSTLSVDFVTRLAAEFQTRNLSFLEAPVSGTLPRVEAGELIYFIGGEADVLKRAQAVLGVLGNDIRHIGPPGSGTVTKLAVNALLAIQVTSLAELIAFLRASGVPLAPAMDALVSNPASSPAMRVFAEPTLAGNFKPMFPVELALKDLGYLADAAKAKSGEQTVISTVTDLFDEAVRKGLGGLNINGISRLYE